MVSLLSNKPCICWLWLSNASALVLFGSCIISAQYVFSLLWWLYIVLNSFLYEEMLPIWYESKKLILQFSIPWNFHFSLIKHSFGNNNLEVSQGHFCFNTSHLILQKNPFSYGWRSSMWKVKLESLWSKLCEEWKYNTFVEFILVE